MKICFIIGNNPYESSLYWATRDVIEQLISEGHQVNYALFNMPEKGLHDGDVCLHVKGLSQKTLKGWRGLPFKLLKNILGVHFYQYLFSHYFCKQLSKQIEAYDAVVVHGLSFVPLHTIKDKIFAVVHNIKYPSLILKRAKYKRPFYQWLYRQVYSGAKLMTVSEGVKQDMLNCMKAKPKCITTVLNGFNPERMRNDALLMQAPALPDKFIMAAGRPDMTKRFDILLQAYAQTQRTHKLVIFGDGRKLYKLKQLATDLNIENDVVFFGYCSVLLSCFLKADAYILSSDIEGLPTVIIESLILNTPVVATNACGVNELLVDDLSQWIVPKRDTKALANKIDEVLVSPPTVSWENIKFLNSKIIAKNYIDFILENK